MLILEFYLKLLLIEALDFKLVLIEALDLKCKEELSFSSSFFKELELAEFKVLG
jgi:hypothetical protein